MTDIKSLGHFEGKVHILPLRIYYEDTDLSGVVYHANYLRFMDRGRSEFFRSLDVFKLACFESETIAWTVRRVEIEYFRPARIDDLIEVHTRIVTMTGARMSFEQTIFVSNVLLARGLVEVCIVTLTGKPRRITKDTRDKLLPYLYETKNGIVA